MDELRILDEDLKAFKLLGCPLYDGYTQARKIINSGGSKDKPGVRPPVFGWGAGGFYCDKV